MKKSLISILFFTLTIHGFSQVIEEINCYNTEFIEDTTITQIVCVQLYGDEQYHNTLEFSNMVSYGKITINEIEYYYDLDDEVGANAPTVNSCQGGVNEIKSGTYIIKVKDTYTELDSIYQIKAIGLKYIDRIPFDNSVAVLDLNPDDNFKNAKFDIGTPIYDLFPIMDMVQIEDGYGFEYKVSPPTPDDFSLINIEGVETGQSISENENYKVRLEKTNWDRCELWISTNGGDSFELIGNNFGSTQRDSFQMVSYESIETNADPDYYNTKEIILRAYGYQSEDSIVGKSPGYWEESYRVFKAPKVVLKNQFRYCDGESNTNIVIDTIYFSNTYAYQYKIHCSKKINNDWVLQSSSDAFETNKTNFLVANNCKNNEEYLIKVENIIYTEGVLNSAGLFSQIVTIKQRDKADNLVPEVLTLADLPGNRMVNSAIDALFPQEMDGNLVDGNYVFIPNELNTEVYFRDLDPKCQETKNIEYRTTFPYLDVTPNIDQDSSLLDDLSIYIDLTEHADNYSDYKPNDLNVTWSIDGNTFHSPSNPFLIDNLDRTKDNTIPVKIKFTKTTAGVGKGQSLSAIDEYEINIPKYPGIYFEAEVSKQVTGCAQAYSGEIRLDAFYNLKSEHVFKIYADNELIKTVPFNPGGNNLGESTKGTNPGLGSNEQIIDSIPAGVIKILGYKEGSSYLWEETLLMEEDASKIIDVSNIEYNIQDVENCSYDKTGSIEITVNDGALNYNYQTKIENEQWAPVYLYENLGKGSYTISTRLENHPEHCVFEKSISISAPKRLILKQTDFNNPLCAETNTGNIDLKYTSNGKTPIKKYWLENQTTGQSWNSVSTEATTWAFSNLPEGNYDIYAIDLLGCSTDTLNSVLTDPALITLTDTIITHVECHSEANGAIKLGGIQGEKPFIISINDTLEITTADSVINIPNLTAGVYDIVITNENNCDGPELNIEIKEPEPIDIQFVYETFNGYGIQCYESTNSVKAIATGGNGNYQITFSSDTYNLDSITTQPLKAGEYAFYLKDQLGCDINKTLTLNEPDSLNIVIDNITEPTCSGYEDGSIELHGEGGVSSLPYILNWISISNSEPIQDTISSNIIIENLKSDRYLFDITDANDCKFSDQNNNKSLDTIIPTTDPIEISSINFTNPLCYGSADGTLAFTVSHTLKTDKTVTVSLDGVSLFTDSFNNASLDVSLNNLIEGTYLIEVVEDGTGCSASTNIDLDDPEPLTYSFEVTDVTCFGDTDGVVNIQPTGGTASYDVQISGAASQSDNGASVINFSNLVPGNYSIALTDQNNCESFSTQGNTFTIREPLNPLTINLSFTQPTCNGDTDGTILSVADGGWQSYEYSKDSANWNMGTDFTFDNLTAGDYRVFVRDTQSCVTSADITVVEPAVLEASNVTVIDANCPGSSDGSFEVFPTGGNGSYELYYEDNLMPDLTVNDLPEGNYDYLVKDHKGCQTIDNTTVNDPDDFSHSFSLNDYNGFNIRCNGLNDTVKININGGSPGYSIQTGGFGFAQEINTHRFDVNNLMAGDYSFTFTDDHGCEYEIDTSLTEPSPVTIANISIEAASCHNYLDGNITGRVVGGIDHNDTDQYSLTLTGTQSDSELFENDFIFSELHAGNYQIIATDINGCTNQLDTLVTQPDPLTATFDATPVVCKGDANGVVNVNPSGGTLDYAYQWFDESDNQIATSKSVSDIPAGIYYAIVTDMHGCTMADTLNTSIEVTEPATALSIAEENIIPVRCFGETNGSITVNAQGGWGSYNYTDTSTNWSAISIFPDLAANTYRFYVRDNRNCIDSVDIEMTQPDTILVTNVDISQPVCFGEANGTVNIDVIGGNGTYEYAMAGQTQSETLFTGIAAGDYLANIQDMLGCAISHDITVGQPEAIAFNVESLVRPACGRNDGALTLSAQGGTGILNIDWQGDSLVNEFSLANLYAGTYGFAVTDDHNCILNDQVTLNNIDGPEMAVNEITMPQCSYSSDGSIVVNISGMAPPFDVEWTSNSGAIPGYDQVDNLPGGVYLVTVRDTNNCYFSEEITLHTPAPLTTSTHTTPVVCKGDENGLLKLNIEGGVAPYSGFWSEDGNNWHIFDAVSGVNMGAGTYLVKVQDDHNCYDASTIENGILPPVQIIEPDEPLSLNASPDGTSCFNYEDGMVVLTGNGGWRENDYEFAINNGAFTTKRVFKNLPGGLHTAHIIDFRGCRKEVDFSIDEPDELLTGVSEYKDVRCNGDASGWIQLASNGGTAPYYYQMNGTGNFVEEFVFDDLQASVYSFVVKDINECSDTISWTINQPDSLLFASLNAIPSYCLPEKGKVELSMTGGTAPYLFADSTLWFDEFTDIENLAEGNYTINISDNYGCEVEGRVHIDFVPGTQIIIDDISEPSCYGFSDGTISLNVEQGTPPFNVWLNGSLKENMNLENLNAGNYEVIVTDQNDCIDTADITIVQPDSLWLNITKTFDPVCFNEPTGYIETEGMGGTAPYSIAWNTNSTSFTPDELLAGIYSYAITDGHNCLNTGTITLENPDPIVTILPDTMHLCSNQTKMLDAVYENFSYMWYKDDQFAGDAREYEVTGAGEYTLELFSPEGCRENDTTLVIEYDYEADAYLLMPTNARVNDTVIMIDISWPVPDSLEWIVPSTFDILDQMTWEVHTQPTQEGGFLAGLITYTGNCVAEHYKSVTIEGFNNGEGGGKSSDVFVAINMAPNPARENALVVAEMGDNQPIKVQLINNHGDIVRQKQLEAATRHQWNINLNGLSKGLYFVRLVAKNEQRYLKLIVI